MLVVSLVILELSYKAQHAGLHNLSLSAVNAPF
jgi:hypothetical protein